MFRQLDQRCFNLDFSAIGYRSLGRVIGQLLKQLDKLGPAVGITRVIERIHADKNMVRAVYSLGCLINCFVPPSLFQPPKDRSLLTVHQRPLSMTFSLFSFSSKGSKLHFRPDFSSIQERFRVLFIAEVSRFMKYACFSAAASTILSRLFTVARSHLSTMAPMKVTIIGSGNWCVFFLLFC